MYTAETSYEMENKQNLMATYVERRGSIGIEDDVSRRVEIRSTVCSSKSKCNALIISEILNVEFLKTERLSSGERLFLVLGAFDKIKL